MKVVFSRMTKKEIILIIISMTLIACSVVADLMQPFLFSEVNKEIQSIVQSSGRFDITQGFRSIFPRVGELVGIMAGVSAAGISLNLISIFISIRISVNLSMRLRIDTYSKIQYLSLQDVEKFSTSSLISRLNNDISQVQSMLITMFNVLVKTPFYIIGGFLLSSLQIIDLSNKGVENSGYIAFAYCLIPFMLAGAATLGKKSSGNFNKAREYFDLTNKIMIENLKGSRIVRAFDLEENQMDRFDYVNTGLKEKNIKGEIMINAIMPIIMFLANLSVGLVIIFSSYASMDTSPSNIENVGILVSDVTAFIQYFSMILLGFMFSSMSMYFIVKGKVSANRIKAVLDTEPSIKDIENPIEFEKGSIEFKNVTFGYNEEAAKPVLDNVSFKAPAGKSIGIIGETGSGKSTLVNLIPRMFDVNQGEVLVSDTNVKDLRLQSLKDNLSFAFQEKILFKGTVKSNIQVGKQDATDEEIIEALKIAEAYDFVSEKDGFLDAVVEQRGSNFSGGQKQRLSIARAIVAKPSILIFDDSTSALDNITEKKLLTNIKKNLKDTTLVMVAQRVKSIQDLDNIIVLDQGKVIGQGNHKQLLKSCKVYKKIYESQNTSVGE